MLVCYLNRKPALIDSRQEQRQHGLKAREAWRRFLTVLLFDCVWRYDEKK